MSGTEGAPRQVSGPRFDQPLIEDESQPFWDGLTEGRLRIKLCAACGRHHHYPRPFCPHCWSEDVDWVDASGDATLYTYSTVYVNDLPPFGPEVPYVAAVVELAEGPRLMTRLVGCERDDIRIGMALKVRYEPFDETLSMAVFAPA